MEMSVLAAFFGVVILALVAIQILDRENRRLVQELRAIRAERLAILERYLGPIKFSEREETADSAAPEANGASTGAAAGRSFEKARRGIRSIGDVLRRARRLDREGKLAG